MGELLPWSSPVQRRSASGSGHAVWCEQRPGHLAGLCTQISGSTVVNGLPGSDSREALSLGPCPQGPPVAGQVTI